MQERIKVNLTLQEFLATILPGTVQPYVTEVTLPDGSVYETTGVSWSKVREAGGAAHVFASATDSDEVTPSDATVLDFKALYVGTGGTVVIKHTESGTIKTFTNVQDGSILPVAGVRVMAATTASGIMALRW